MWEEIVLKFKDILQKAEATYLTKAKGVFIG